MSATTVFLYKAEDSDESWALALRKDPPDSYRAETGYGGKFRRVWTVEIQGDALPDLLSVNWDAVLERVIEAYDLSDPVITNFRWPHLSPH